MDMARYENGEKMTRRRWWFSLGGVLILVDKLLQVTRPGKGHEGGGGRGTKSVLNSRNFSCSLPFPAHPIHCVR